MCKNITVLQRLFDFIHFHLTLNQKDEKLTWIHKCATLPHAISARNHGADFIVIVGLEGTGFKNPTQNTTLINITVAKKMLSTHLIAAGGIADARGFLAALAAGASAVCFGTLFMATTECPMSERYKRENVAGITGFDDPEFYRSIFHLELKDRGNPSMAVGLINDIVPMKERIERIIINAENILRDWGFKDDIITIS